MLHTHTEGRPPPSNPNQLHYIETHPPQWRAKRPRDGQAGRYRHGRQQHAYARPPALHPLPLQQQLLLEPRSVCDAGAWGQSGGI